MSSIIPNDLDALFGRFNLRGSSEDELSNGAGTSQQASRNLGSNVDQMFESRRSHKRQISRENNQIQPTKYSKVDADVKKERIYSTETQVESPKLVCKTDERRKVYVVRRQLTDISTLKELPPIPSKNTFVAQTFEK